MRIFEDAKNLIKIFPSKLEKIDDNFIPVINKKGKFLLEWKEHPFRK
jgi:hypothetical protein